MSDLLVRVFTTAEAEFLFEPFDLFLGHLLGFLQGVYLHGIGVSWGPSR